MKVVDIANGNVVNVLGKVLSKDRPISKSYKISKWQKIWQQEYAFVQEKLKKIKEDSLSLKDKTVEEMNEFENMQAMELSNVEVELEQLDYSLIDDSELSSSEFLLIQPLLKNLPND